HLFEVTGVMDLAPEFGPSAAFPGEETWRMLVAERCTPLSTQFLGGRFDPFGKFSVGAIKPSEGSWRRGDRELRCGLQVVGRSGALFPTTGSAATQDQSDVHETGTCLGLDGIGVGDPVDCAQPHAVEIVGVVDLGAAFPGGYPDEAAQDRLLSEQCNQLATGYTGGPQVVGEKGLIIFSETLRPESWEAGSRRVDCRLGAFLPDRSGFAPVTGSVRGEVQVGTEPAPPLQRTHGPARTTPAVPPAPTPGPG
ncbi:MAG: septum formation family protein, partial [Actinomycetota bacterium]|nr:septum formation family protein [Actinomycetota bacterium]